LKFFGNPAVMTSKQYSLAGRFRPVALLAKLLDSPRRGGVNLLLRESVYRWFRLHNAGISIPFLYVHSLPAHSLLIDGRLPAFAGICPFGTIKYTAVLIVCQEEILAECNRSVMGGFFYERSCHSGGILFKRTIDLDFKKIPPENDKTAHR
jgi:hypothetical protein